MDLFDYAGPKEEAMQRAFDHADASWKSLMTALVERVACQKREFTTDDVFDLYREVPLAPTTHDSRALGPVMRKVAMTGAISKTDRVIPSRRSVSNHNRPLAIWRSNIYGK